MSMNDLENRIVQVMWKGVPKGVFEWTINELAAALRVSRPRLAPILAVMVDRGKIAVRSRHGRGTRGPQFHSLIELRGTKP